MLHFNHGRGVTLLGAGPVDQTTLGSLLRIAPDLYCADGGVNTAPKAPLAVIGDMDSICGKSTRFQDVKKVLIEDQDTTDFEKCLAAIQAPFYLCAGFMGGRLDHQLAAQSALAKNPEKSAFLVGESEFCFLAPQTLCLDLGKFVPISLYPITPTQAVSRGLKWPVDGLDLRPDGRIATSNETDADQVEIKVTLGKALVILPLSELLHVIDQLYQTD